MTKELNQARELVLEKDEEISELKAERNNTRLLLEHLECLVSRHERSLRMTVVKRQTASQSGVSSEVEVLKALKSLFEHHKALDEKVRERLRVALEKNTSLEEECSGVRDELSRYKLGLIEAEAQKVTAGGSQEVSSFTNGGEELDKKVNGAHPEPSSEVYELRKQVGRIITFSRKKIKFLIKYSIWLNLRWRSTPTTWEMQPAQSQSCAPRSPIVKPINFLNKSTQVTELENKLISNNKELHAAQDLNQALQHEYKETMAQKEDQVNQPSWNYHHRLSCCCRFQEERIATLEKRYLNSQREATQLHDLNERVEQEMKNKDEQICLYQEKIKAVNEKLDISEQKLIE